MRLFLIGLTWRAVAHGRRVHRVQGSHAQGAEAEAAHVVRHGGHPARGLEAVHVGVGEGGLREGRGGVGHRYSDLRGKKLSNGGNTGIHDKCYN